MNEETKKINEKVSYEEMWANECKNAENWKQRYMEEVERSRRYRNALLKVLD